MAKFRISAESVGYLEETIEAKNEDEAWEILEKKLEMGDLEEVDGSIENKKVEKVTKDYKTAKGAFYG